MEVEIIKSFHENENFSVAKTIYAVQQLYYIPQVKKWSDKLFKVV